MKKIIRTSTLIMAIAISIFAITIEAKPAYCGVALTKCYNTCGHSILAEFCDTGCNIGYLMCG